MAQSSACCSPCQNPHDGKNELTDGTLTKDSNHWIPVPTAIRAPTPAVAPVVALFVTFGSVDSFVVKYLEDNLQQIARIIFETKSLLFPVPAPVPAPVVTSTPHYEGPRERPLKAWFSNIYQGEMHLECYNFFQ